MSVSGTATCCRGIQFDGVGVGLQAGIAVGCTATGSLVSPQKHLGS